MQPNNVWLQVPHCWIYTVNLFLKNEITYNNSCIVEHSVIDNKQNYILTQYIKNASARNRLIIFYQYYVFSIRLKLTLLTYTALTTKIPSLDLIYKSLSWLERESAEMFKIKFANKTDIRRLLLDYTKNENPLLKDFPTEGYNDVYYCFFNDQVIFESNTTTEL